MLGRIYEIIEKYLFPDKFCQSIYEIDFAGLHASGITGLALDVDNTLVPPGARKPDGRAAALIGSLRDAGFEICIVSNSTRRRVAEFATGFGVFAISGAGKPAAAGFLKASRLLKRDLAGMCAIGDQIFTDVLGAKRVGMKSILTKKLTGIEIFTVMLKRIPEFFVIRMYMKKAAREGAG